MSEQEKKHLEKSDWELSEAYYHVDTEAKEMSLEEFMDDDSSDLNADSGLSSGSEVSEKLQQVAADVTKILALSSQGKNASVIAQELGVEPGYVSDIMACIQAFPEDNPLAVARLIVLG